MSKLMVIPNKKEDINIILNKDKNLLITIMSTEKDMKNVTEILRNLI